MDEDRRDPWAEATERAWGGKPAPPKEEDHPEPVALCSLPLQEAMLLVGRLQEAGIPARVDSDVSENLIFGLRMLKQILVPRSRLAEARAVVEEIESGADRI